MEVLGKRPRMQVHPIPTYAACPACHAALAVMEARRLAPAPPRLPGRLEAAVAAFRLLALASIALLLLTAAARVPLLRRLLAALPCCRPLLACALRGGSAAAVRRRSKLEDATPPASPVAGGSALVQLVEEGQVDALKPGFSSGLSVRRSASNLGPRARNSSDDDGSAARFGSPDRLAGRQAAAPRRGASSWLRSLLAWLPTVLAALLLATALCGQWGARETARVAQPFLAPAVPLPVQGKHSKFTLMVRALLGGRSVLLLAGRCCARPPPPSWPSRFLTCNRSPCPRAPGGRS